MLTIYYHKDFDGIVAAALFAFIMTTLNKYKKFTFLPVDYDLKSTWNNKQLEKPCAVLDFLYHPDADYYYDHHSTSFLDNTIKIFKESKKKFLWDQSFKSTPSLLVHAFKDEINFDKYNYLIKWADIIDSAEYSKPNDLYNNHFNYILLNKLISYFKSNKLDANLAEIISIILHPNIDKYLENYASTLDLVLQREKEMMNKLKNNIIIKKNICLFNQEIEEVEYQRYLPYYYYPSIDYCIGIYKRDEGYAISIGFNPWKKGNPVNLGNLAKKFDGGGRQNVAGILTNSRKKGLEIAKLIINELISDET